MVHIVLLDLILMKTGMGLSASKKGITIMYSVKRNDITTKE